MEVDLFIGLGLTVIYFPTFYIIASLCPILEWLHCKTSTF
jgi:hypothetical protein